MQVYLPIAELSEPVWLLIALGGATGVLAGLFGIGGGFILTPLLIFMGVEPAVAVATSACQIVASSFSGFLHHWKHRRVDVQMGNVLIAGGILGAVTGTIIFAALQRSGQADITIALMYVCLLGTIAIVMGREGWQLLRSQSETLPQSVAYWPIIQKLPLQVYFGHSQVTHSIFVPAVIGLAVGLIVSLMGVGGGFILIPAMMYILRMPSGVLVGTSLYQIIFITGLVTLMHAYTTQTVDIVLSTLLLIGSVIGAQFGARLSAKISNAHSRIALSLLLAFVAGKLALGLFTPPSELFTLLPRE